MKKRGRRHSSSTGTVRIISGRWRGSRLPVPNLPGLRPSGDRSRETLFNWLQPHLPGAFCVDLFAGSGVLGMEAASRGAGRVILVEKERVAADVLRANLRRLKAIEVEVRQDDALDWLTRQTPAGIDIVFVDPPFGSDLVPPTLDLLSVSGVMAKGGFIYVETSRSETSPGPPTGWELWREKVLGEVRMNLFRCG